jgi:predicted molibdopterin-dependent oxidoreductase YjgC
MIDVVKGIEPETGYGTILRLSEAEATWEEALSLVARRLSEIKAQHGPDSIGLIASSKCTNEESYLMQKLARAVVGTNNIDNCSRYCQSPATAGLFRTVGYGRSPCFSITFRIDSQGVFWNPKFH